jgi:plastocyanin
MRFSPLRLIGGGVLAGTLLIGGLAAHVHAAQQDAAKNTCVAAPTDGKGGPYPAKATSNCTALKAVTINIMADPKITGAFVPSNITIKKGTKVTWVWKTTPHNVYFDPKYNLDSSQVMTNVGAKFSITFSKSGTFPYICQVHLGQKGVIVVK